MDLVSHTNPSNQSIGGRLSADVICEILLLLLGHWEEDSNSYDRSDTGHPWDHDENLLMDIPIAPNLPQLALSHICRQWRLVALDLPRFWASFFVSVRGDHQNFGPARIPGRTAALHASMARSGDYPMNIAVHCINWDAPDLKGLLEALITYGQRLKYAKISVPAPFFSVLRTLSGAQVPNLERLTIIVWEDFDPEAPFDANNDFFLDANLLFVATAPRLVHLSFDVLDGNCTRLPPLPHSQLRTLHLQCEEFGSYALCTTSILNLLHISPSLVSLSISMPGTEYQNNEPDWDIMPSEEDWFETHDVHAPNLEYLELEVFVGSEHIDTDTILRTLIAPKLHTLTLPSGKTTAPDALDRFLARSKPPLRTLKNSDGRTVGSITSEP
ncbi:hypothetical protein C8J57DRAFT_414345 [Mycena rebaudengoi]|nr:hypothetical protein C8J57DRAFT_414345 [Mycena rebaudengoi]